MEKNRVEEFQDLFFARVMGGRFCDFDLEPLTAGRAQEGLLDLAATLQLRFPPAGEADTKWVPEEALMEAIASMAEYDEVEAFASMRPPLRQAVRARLRTLLTLVLANEAKSADHISVVPRGLPDEHVGMALLVTMGVGLPRALRTKLE